MAQEVIAVIGLKRRQMHLKKNVKSGIANTLNADGHKNFKIVIFTRGSKISFPADIPLFNFKLNSNQQPVLI